MTCKKDGCINLPISRGKYCNEHRTNKKQCQIHDCISSASGNTQYCKKHGGGKRCQEPDCKVTARGKSNFCVIHGGGKRCKELDCISGARENTDLCRRHGGGKRCQESECKLSAKGTTNYCTAHGGGTRCQIIECTKGAVGKTNYCTAHGGGNRCQIANCTESAREKSNFCTKHGGGNRCQISECNSSTPGSAQFCKKHGGGNRCQESNCISSAQSPSAYCKKHGGGKRCLHLECKTSARAKSNFCAKHGGGDRCPNCINWIDSRLANSKYDGYCITCFKHIFPKDPRSVIIHEHTKELRIRNAINTHFEGFIHDKPLYTGNCDCSHRRRVDHRKLIDNTILAIETDEFAHKRYNKIDEEIRYDDLYMIHSGKWIYIRFNPDKTKEHKIDMEDRITLLLEVIEQQIDRIIKEENTELVEIIKLFY